MRPRGRCGTLGVVNILIYGDTETTPALRHEVPVAIGDPFLYLESDGRRAVLTNALEESRIAARHPSSSACWSTTSDGTS